MTLVETVVAHYELIGWNIQLAYILGDGVVAVREGSEDSGFRLYFDTGAEGRRKVHGMDDLWVVDDDSFNRVFSFEAAAWLEAAQKVVDAHWLSAPREMKIPLSIIA
jgi:hypothetical protein